MSLFEPLISDKSPAAGSWLVGLVLLFLVLRLPVVVCQIPAQDEDYFAVPGWTILNEGIPRIPYMPARNEDSAFYRADEMLFSLPPLYFYVQALFYLVCGSTTFVARLVCLVCGIIASLVVFQISRETTGSLRVAIWATGLYLFSRVIYFPCVVARPDMLCALFGLLTLLFVNRFSQGGSFRQLMLAGLCAGLGMLTHPFALVYCLQAGCWILLIDSPWKGRLRSATIFTLTALVAFSPWGLLIVQAPELFEAQFTNNVLRQTGPGLFQRLLFPFESFAAQIPLYIAHSGVLQSILLTVGSIYVIVKAARTRERTVTLPAVLVCSGIYLHVACQGMHPTKGYWVYTCAFQFVCVGIAISDLFHQSAQRFAPRWSRAVRGLACALLVASLVPGGGLRTFAVYATRGGETDYNAPRFTRALMKHFQRNQRLVVDPGYVFDFQRAGYDVILGLNYRPFFDVADSEYDYFVAGPTSIRDDVATDLSALEMKRLGSFEDPFACRAILYRHPSQAELP